MFLSALYWLVCACSEHSVIMRAPIENEQDKQRMMYIPSGIYRIGSDQYTQDEAPRHEISLPSFYMGKTEVTNAQFAHFLNERQNKNFDVRKWIALSQEIPRGAMISFTGTRYRAHYGYEDHPVIGISFFGATAYCKWADLRLPSEQEWEVAAQGGKEGALYPWGDESPQGKANYGHKWRDSVHKPPTEPVGQYPENGYGLVDMAGNTLEWTKSPYIPYQKESITEDLRASLDGRRVLRGGGFDSDVEELHITFRRAYYERVRSYFTGGLGFRCARDANPS